MREASSALLGVVVPFIIAMAAAGPIDLLDALHDTAISAEEWSRGRAVGAAATRSSPYAKHTCNDRDDGGLQSQPLLSCAATELFTPSPFVAAPAVPVPPVVPVAPVPGALSGLVPAGFVAGAVVQPVHMQAFMQEFSLAMAAAMQVAMTSAMQQMQVQAAVATATVAAAAPASMGAAVAAALLADSLVLEASEKLPAEVHSHLVACAKKYEKAVRRFINAEAACLKLKDQVDLLNEKDSAGFGRVPPGCRPCKTPVELVQLDDVYPACAQGDLVVNVRIPKGCTFRDSMKHFHHAHLLFSRTLQLEAEQLCCAAARSETSKGVFLAACNNFASAVPPQDGLEDPLVRAISGTAARKKAESLYSDVITRLRAERVAKDVAVKKQADKAAKLQSQLEKAKPSELLHEVIDNLVDKKVSAALRSTHVKQEDLDLEDDAVMATAVAVGSSDPSKLAFLDRLPQGNAATLRSGAGARAKTGGRAKSASVAWWDPVQSLEPWRTQKWDANPQWVTWNAVGRRRSASKSNYLGEPLTMRPKQVPGRQASAKAGARSGAASGSGK